MSFDPNRFNPQPKPERKEKKKPTPIKRSAIKKKSEPTGEAEIFLQIWNSRCHYSFIKKNGELIYLGNDMMSWFFAHVLSKAANRYPLFKLEPRYIVLLTREQHDQWDARCRSEIINDPDWAPMFELERQAKEEYSQLKNQI